MAGVVNVTGSGHSHRQHNLRILYMESWLIQVYRDRMHYEESYHPGY